MNIESFPLVLKHSDIADFDNNTLDELITVVAGTDNTQTDRGGWVAGRQTSHFKVDFSQILGESYSANDTYMLRLNSMATSYADSYPETIFDEQMDVVIGGLDWQNSSYSVKDQGITNKVVIVSQVVARDKANTFSYPPNMNCAMFRLSRGPQVTITIDLQRQIDGGPCVHSATSFLPFFNWHFSILKVAEAPRI
jgi:hypothetical protein